MKKKYILAVLAGILYGFIQGVQACRPVNSEARAWAVSFVMLMIVVWAFPDKRD